MPMCANGCGREPEEFEEGKEPFSDESEIRDRFMDAVYEQLSEDGTNDRANTIIRAFDEAQAPVLSETARLRAELEAARKRYEELQSEYDRALEESHNNWQTVYDYGEEMREERDAAQRRAEAAEQDIAQMLSRSTIGLCVQYCKNHKPFCSGMGRCVPEWRGLGGQEGV